MALTDLTAQLKLKERKNENTFLFFKADFSIFCIEEFLEQKGEISGINSFLVSVYFLPETAPHRMYICKITNMVERFKKR